MRALSRREWVDLVSAHPGVDPANPSDEFAAALITATGGDPEVWETGGEGDAARAYGTALTLAHRDTTWARDTLLGDPTTSAVVRAAVECGISPDELLAWSDRAQDLVLEWVRLREDRCPAGHPREAMNDPDQVKVGRVYCAVCARVHAIEESVKDLGPDARVGWHTEVTRVSR